MGKIKELETLVKQILTENPIARDSDNDLYYIIILKMRDDVLRMPLGYVLKNYHMFGLPRYESVGRVRRKVQEANPELLGSDRVEKVRKKSEAEFRAYARSCRRMEQEFIERTQQHEMQ